MPKNSNNKFALRIQRFFKSRSMELDSVKGEGLINFLFEQFKKQNRLKDDEQHFRITPSFVFNAVSNYLKNHSSPLISSSKERPKRSSANYQRSQSADPIPTRLSKRGLIDLLGRKNKLKYKVTKADGSPLTPISKEKVKAYTSSFEMSDSPFKSVNAAKPRERATTNTASYEKDMESTGLALWHMQTPKKKGELQSPYRVRFQKSTTHGKNEETLKKLASAYDCNEKKGTKEVFEFWVTQEDIMARIGAQRPISQNRVMNDCSAIDTMKAMGAILLEKQNGRNFHWAHRQGWSLNGEQSQNNLDPTTAGSNYDTLFKVEAPLTKLLLDKDNGADEVCVHGEVEFDKEQGLPYKINYTLSWGTGEKIKVVIDPMSHRVPNVEEHEMALSFIKMNMAPK
jgi:hypothetical protein